MSGPAADAPAMPPRIGATLGRYQIEATLGHGAMATVFRARDTQLGRDVAIKVMGMVHAMRAGAAERFRREAQAVAALKHPGIVEIYDFVEASDDIPSYIVAELIAGPTLRQLVDGRGGRVLPEIAALVALPLAEALAVAHGHGVVHRDLKPDNVMLETTGDRARVVLTDFGVAHITGMETMTATGALVGSPAYMSPEQSRGHEVTPAADLWSFGVMLYELATGVVPFAGKDPYTMIAAILRGTFRRPSQVVATVGPDFEAIVMRCLKPTPSERFNDAHALAGELRSFIAAAGIASDGKLLHAYLDAPEPTLQALRGKVAESALARARQHARRGQLARALAEIGRATAYVPDHPAADRLLRRLSAGRLVIKTVVALVSLGAVAGGLWLARPWLRSSQHPPRETASAPAVPTGEIARHPGPVATASPAPNEPGTDHSLPVAQAPSTTRPHRPQEVSRQRGGRKKPVTALAPTPVREPEPTAGAGATAASAEPTETPPTAPRPAPRPGTVALFAKGAFCYPSLDDYPPGELMPVFRDVPPGNHRIYCSRTKQSPKELAGEVYLPAGGTIERTVTEHDGHLSIAHPR